jgi:hypothetical protein
MSARSPRVAVGGLVSTRLRRPIFLLDSIEEPRAPGP